MDILIAKIDKRRENSLLRIVSYGIRMQLTKTDKAAKVLLSKGSLTLFKPS